MHHATAVLRRGSPLHLVHEAWEEGQEAILEYLEDQTLPEFVSRTVPDGGAVPGVADDPADGRG